MSLYKGTDMVAGTPPVDQSVTQNSVNPVSGGAVYTALGTPVRSFNGRTGVVTPQSGDYTAAMVGADAAGTAASAVSTHNNSASAHSDLFAAKTPIVGKGVNLLDNWYFVGGGDQQGGGQFPINQRGATSYSTSSSAVYTIDRWNTSRGSGSVSIAINSGGIQLSSPSTSYGTFTQLVYAKDLVGKEVTLTFLFDDALVTFTKIVPSVPSSGSTLLKEQFLSSDSDKWIQAYIRSDGLMSATICTRNGKVISNIVAAKLELGDTQTLARQVNGSWVLNDDPPNYEEELAKCQRYQIAFRPSGSTNQYLTVGGAPASNSTTVYISMPIPVTMRSTSPALSYTGSWRLLDGSGSYAVTNMVKDYNASNLAKITVTSSGLTTRRYYNLESSTDATANIILDANL